MKRIGLVIFLIISISVNLQSQNKVHMAGVRMGYNISNVNYSPPKDHSPVNTIKNYSLLYTYYHDLWGASPYFGFQTGVSHLETGFEMGGTRYITEMYQIPLVSQFHIDFWKMRLLLNIGGYGAYRNKRLEPESYTFEPDDYRMEFGIIAGGGLAVVLKPFEVHLEANYNYSFTYLNDPRKGDSARPLYSYPNQFIISASLFFHIKSK